MYDSKTIFAVVALALLGIPFLLERGKRLAHGEIQELPGTLLFLFSIAFAFVSFASLTLSVLILISSTLISSLYKTARKRAHENIVRLTDLRVKNATLLKSKTETLIPVEKLKTGDIIQIKPGEPIPCDGIIVTGTTRVDEVNLTGETTPLFKTKGDRVLAGTFNQDGSIQVQLTEELCYHYLERIIAEINRIQQAPSKKQKKLELALKILAVTSTLTSLAVLYIFGVTPPYWQLALSILSPFCFVTWSQVWPMIHTIALGALLKKGVLISKIDSLHRLAGLDTLFFDKTGILTEGDYLYSQSFLEFGVNQGTFLSALFTLETYSNHPLAQAVQTHPWYLEIPKYEVKDFKIHPGLGICGTLSERGKREHFVAVGNQRFLRRFQMQISNGMREKVDTLELMGETVVLCGWNREVKGCLSFSDDIRPDMKPMLTELNAMGIKPVLITGDHEEMISHLTHTKGLQDVYMRCLPEEKVKKIKKYQDEKHRVGYLVTRHDDLSLLATANAGIVMHSGPHLQPPTVDASVIDASVFGSQLIRVSELLRIARKTHRALSLSYGIGVGFTLIAIGLTFSGLLIKEVAPFIPTLALALNSTAALTSCWVSIRLKKLEKI